MGNAASQGLVAVTGSGEVVGYCFWWRAADEADIHTVTVAPQLRRCGVASQLLRSVVDSACSHGIRRLTLEVRSSNHAAIALYRKHGFSEDTVRRDYYGKGEHAVLMSRALSQGNGGCS
jgi:ribosomal-protein-alanine N-acetyltransferase